MSTIQVLEQAARDDVPFLVIEPRGRSYRELLTSEGLADRLRVYTPGNPRVAPLSINPLQIIPGTNIWWHINRILEIFHQCYELSEAVAHALELCLAQAYLDRGWSLITNSSWRLSGDAASDDYVPELQPTLEDVLRVVDPIVDGCDLAAYVRTDIKTILKSLLGSLLFGQQKLTFTQRSRRSIEELFMHPTVIELTALGNEPGKSFIVAVLLLFLEEHRSRHQSNNQRRFIVVLEDAHRLDSLWRAGSPIGQAPTVWLDKVLEALRGGDTTVILVGDQPAAPGSKPLRQVHAGTESEASVKSAAKGTVSGQNINKADSRSRSKSVACPDSMVSAAMATAIADSAAIDCLGCNRFPGGCGPETHVLADQLISDYRFRTIFYRYIMAVRQNVAQMVHFRAPVVHEAQRVLGRRFSEQVFWCALWHTCENYFADKAREHFWSLELEQTLKERWLEFLAPAFIRGGSWVDRRLASVSLRQWLTDFDQAQQRDLGPLPTCGSCRVRCLYRLEASELINQAVQFDFNSSINKKDEPTFESAAWFTRLFSERSINRYDRGLAFCMAVHLVSTQALSVDAQQVLLEKVSRRLDEYESNDDCSENKIS